jgi:hypothetical protein
MDTSPLRYISEDEIRLPTVEKESINRTFQSDLNLDFLIAVATTKPIPFGAH